MNTHTQHLFQPKLNGNVSFKQQTIKLYDENIMGTKTLVNKSQTIVDESHREFTGRDITNLTMQNQENINPNGRRSMEIVNQNHKNLSVQFINNEFRF